MKRRRGLWLLVGSLIIGAWLAPKFFTLPITRSEGYEPFGPPTSYTVSRVVKDDRPDLQLDPGQPWRIEFGRGSGWHGLNTVKLDQDGQVNFYQLRSERPGGVSVLSWETATARFPPEAVAEVLKTVSDNRLMELDKAYHADVCDGTQWVLWVRQGDREKAVYFNNHFPEPIIRFARQLDATVVASIGPSLKWRAVPSTQDRDHERELWESIHR